MFASSKHAKMNFDADKQSVEFFGVKESRIRTFPVAYEDFLKWN